MLVMLVDAAKQMPAIFREDPLPEIVYRSLAEIPMDWLKRKQRRGWLFDAEELYRRVGAA